MGSPEPLCGSRARASRKGIECTEEGVIWGAMAMLPGGSQISSIDHLMQCFCILACDWFALAVTMQ